MSEKSEKPERRAHKVKCASVKIGDLMAFTYYGKVVEMAQGGTHLRVAGIGPGSPDRFEVIGEKLIVGAASADQHHEEVVSCITRIAEMLIASPNKPLTVCFIKKNDDERIMRCRFIAQESLLGRSYVEDLDKLTADNEAIRQVDHRTLKWLVVDGVKYVVK